MTELVLIRGLPGSGKSTLAETKYPNHIHAEADEHFMRHGEYIFIKRELPRAHKACVVKALFGLENNEDVVVSNTFTTYSEMKQYVQCGRYDKLTIVDLSHQQFRSIHLIPDEAMLRMIGRWESFESIKKKVTKFHGDNDVTLQFI